MKTLNIFYLIIYRIQKVQTSFYYVVSSACNTSVPAFWKCMDASIKKILLTESAATRAPPAGPLRRTWKTCLPSPVWAAQTHENHWGRGLASMADVEDTRRAYLGLLQQFNGTKGTQASFHGVYSYRFTVTGFYTKLELNCISCLNTCMKITHNIGVSAFIDQSVPICIEGCFLTCCSGVQCVVW
jgi:hypothetical protein